MCMRQRARTSSIQSMSLRVFFLAALACSNAAAFMVPLASRAALPTTRRAPVSRRSAARAPAGNTAPNMRYVAMNRFKVKLGCEDEFETMWRERESKLDSFSGFEQFMLLKLDTREAEKKEEEGEVVARAGYTEFVSHTVWAHQMDFEEWKRSQAFKRSHGGGGGGGGGGGEVKGKEEGGGGKAEGMVIKAGGMGKIKDLIVEPPTPMLYNAAIIEPVPPEHQGGLWEFEDEPSYFDGDM